MNNTKSTITGHSVPEVASVGTLGIQTNHPRSFVIIDQVTGSVQRGARGEFALRSKLRDTDFQGAAEVLRRAAAQAGVSLTFQPPAPPLPTTISVPGNGTVYIKSLTNTELLFAIALAKTQYGGTVTPSFKALEQERQSRGL